MRVRGKKGFTLIELLVVIMIIGIILVISIPAVVNLQKSQNAKKFDYFTTIVKE
ncbi:MAG TPA: prepilin-type N-terminal cleavage/methylation domain-containing protein, partial [Candidatus Faecenecus gallistercoris]|nr:prepilin-type N-terminal cleavage/methylation domain-containing protein [Candidatus Faecenecus gallistercoris]